MRHSIEKLMQNKLMKRRTGSVGNTLAVGITLAVGNSFSEEQIAKLEIAFQ
jgi:hypothetical protein